MIQGNFRFNSNAELEKIVSALAPLGLVPGRVKKCDYSRKIAFRPAQPTTANDRVPAALAKNQDKRTNEQKEG